MSSQLYILKVDLNIGQQTGIDLAGSLDKLNALLMSYTGSATCLYKYKVNVLLCYIVTPVTACDVTLTALLNKF